MEAGSDTTASQALDFMMALLAFPDVLKKAQEEVDRVCGTSRLPTLDDRDQMPYIEACVNEVCQDIRHFRCQSNYFSGSSVETPATIWCPSSAHKR